MVEAAPHYLHPAEIAIGNPSISSVTTVLGSCVAVTLFLPERFAAICHGVLPSRELLTGETTRYGRFRFVDEAIVHMLEEAKRRGVCHSRLVAKVFGGARITGESPAGSVGDLNLQTAEQKLNEAEIPIVAADVGGTRGRKLLFDLRTGEVLVKRLGRSQAHPAGILR